MTDTNADPVHLISEAGVRTVVEHRAVSARGYTHSALDEADARAMVQDGTGQAQTRAITVGPWTDLP